MMQQQVSSSPFFPLSVQALTTRHHSNPTRTTFTTMSSDTISSARSNLSRLVRQEEESIRSPDNVRRTALHDNIHNNVWRQMIVEWCYQVVDHISADREIVYIAINILDRFLAMQVQGANKASTRDYLTDKKAYETAVMTSLLITLKLQGLNTLCIGDLVKMSSNTVTSRDITETGKEIVHSLSWNNQIPTSARFAHAYVQLLPETICERAKTTLFENAVFQIELSVQDEFCSNQPPSLVAWMAFENALGGIGSRVSSESKNELRSEISKATGHKYSVDLRRRLHTYQLQSHPSQPPANESPVNVIPLDEDEVRMPQSQARAQSTVGNNKNTLTLRSRPMTMSNTISLDDMSSIPSLPRTKVRREERKGGDDEDAQHQHPTYALRRTKRMKRDV